MKLLGFVLLFLICVTQATAQTVISGAGVIESTSGGFKFPDGSIQLSAATPPCTAITFVPFSINAAGIYCFTGNLSTAQLAGIAIHINADNVTINMNGWTLDGLGGGTSTLTFGISSNTSNNVTIRNGTVQGFYYGIDLTDGVAYGGHLVEGIRADTNRIGGIIISGSNSIARRNLVINTGGSTLPTASTGLTMRGPRMRAINNDILNTTASGSAAAHGLLFADANDSVAEGNRIGEVNGGVLTSSVGVLITNSHGVLVKGNTINSTYHGINFFDGSTGKYIDNLTSNTINTFSGGIAVGTNN